MKLVSLALFITAILAHEENQKPQTYKGLTQVTNDNYLEIFEKQAFGQELPMLIAFIIRDCTDCITHAKDWNQLALIAQKAHMIGRTDWKVCDIFNIKKFPFVVMFNKNKIYKYEGSLDLASTLNYLSADNYKNATILAENTQEWYLDATGNNHIGAKLARICQDYFLWCEKQAKVVFKYIGLYYWSDNAKLLCFSMVALGLPCVILSYYLFVFGSYLISLMFGRQEDVYLYPDQYKQPQQQQPMGNLQQNQASLQHLKQD